MPRREGIREALPRLDAAAHLFVGQQARLEQQPLGLLVEIDADEHDLLTAVAEGLLPAFLEPGPCFGVAWTVLLGTCRPPDAGGFESERAARLRPQPRDIAAVGEPHEALASDGLEEAADDEVVEALGVEWPSRLEDKRRHAVLLGLRGVLVVELLDPLGRRLRLGHVESLGVEDGVERHLAESAADDRRVGVQRADVPLHFAEVILADEIALVEDDDVGELDLIGEQVGDRAGVGLVVADAAVGQIVLGLEVLDEVERVNDRDHRVQPRDLGERAALLILERKGLRDGQRLGDARALDEQVFELLLAGEARDLLQQVLAQRAADAAVGHFDHLLVHAVEHGLANLAARLDELGVDVDLAHVIDDHRDPLALAVGKDVVEQRRLARAEEA